MPKIQAKMNGATRGFPYIPYLTVFIDKIASQIPYLRLTM